MPKPPPPGKCIHCLKDSNNLTWDHVIPRGWYPDNTQNNVEKWSVPSCEPCNKEYGKIEEEMLTKAINQKHGKNDIDRKKRSDKRNKILKNLLHGNNIPKEGCYPGFEGTNANNSFNDIALLIDSDHLYKIAKKIVKGIIYINKNIFIQEPYSIKFEVFSEEDTVELHTLLDKHGTVHEIPPGVYIKKAIADDTMSSIFYIELWGKLKMYAFVEKN